MENLVPICLITDKNYVIPTCVLLESMIYNKKSQSLYEVNILADDIEDKHIEILEQYNKENFIVKVFKLKNRYKNLKNKNSYVTNSAFLKFDIPIILKEYNKILYLDSDTIVNNDLSELYNIQLNNTYAGVILDIGDLFYKSSQILTLEKYFNSGVILFNAEKYRQEDLATKLLEIYKNNNESFICHDQDTFNIGFNENITVLPPKYNFQQSINEYPLKSVLKYYQIEKNSLDKNNIQIFHYTRMKPWLYKYAYYQKEWTKYYEMTIFKNIPLKLKLGLFLKYYFILRNYFNLKKINKILKILKENF